MFLHNHFFVFLLILYIVFSCNYIQMQIILSWFSKSFILCEWWKFFFFVYYKIRYSGKSFVFFLIYFNWLWEYTHFYFAVFFIAITVPHFFNFQGFLLKEILINRILHDCLLSMGFTCLLSDETSQLISDSGISHYHTFSFQLLLPFLLLAFFAINLQTHSPAFLQV